MQRPRQIIIDIRLLAERRTVHIRSIVFRKEYFIELIDEVLNGFVQRIEFDLLSKFQYFRFNAGRVVVRVVIQFVIDVFYLDFNKNRSDNDVSYVTFENNRFSVRSARMAFYGFGIPCKTDTVRSRARTVYETGYESVGKNISDGYGRIQVPSSAFGFARLICLRSAVCGKV